MIFDSPNTGIVGSNPAWTMYVFLSVLCSVSAEAFVWADPPYEESYRNFRSSDTVEAKEPNPWNV
jgi:hypothetical protein